MNTQEILKPIAGDFEAWYEKQDYTMLLYGEFGGGFYSLPPDFQLGVLLKYFRERWGMEMLIGKGAGYTGYFYLFHYGNKEYCVHAYSDFNTAFEQALIKAVELALNSKLINK